jgi:hypothetical protein
MCRQNESRRAKGATRRRLRARATGQVDETGGGAIDATGGRAYGGDLQVGVIMNTKQRMAVWAEGVAMIECKVRTIETSGTADIESVWNDLAQDGWRLVNTAAANGAGTAARVWLFFEREAKIPSPTEDDVARKMATQFAQASAATR